MRKIMIPFEKRSLLEEFKPPEKIEEGELACGIALTVEEQIERLIIVTDRYMVEGYLNDIQEVAMDITPEVLVHLGLDEFTEKIGDKANVFLKNGIVVILNIEGKPTRLFIDKYQWSSIPFIVRSNFGYLGSVRLIMKTELRLPTVNDDEITIFSEWQTKAEETEIEISQLAKVAGAPKTVMLALLRNAIQFSRRINIEDWLATTDNRVIRLLNGIMCFDIKPIGNPVYYLGSESVPGFINISNTIRSIGEKSVIKGLAEFFDGQSNVAGYDWYRGI